MDFFEEFEWWGVGLKEVTAVGTVVSSTIAILIVCKVKFVFKTIINKSARSSVDHGLLVGKFKNLVEDPPFSYRYFRVNRTSSREGS